MVFFWLNIVVCFGVSLFWFRGVEYMVNKDFVFVDIKAIVVRVKFVNNYLLFWNFFFWGDFLLL